MSVPSKRPVSQSQIPEVAREEDAVRVMCGPVPGRAWVPGLPWQEQWELRMNTKTEACVGHAAYERMVGAGSSRQSSRKGKREPYQDVMVSTMSRTQLRRGNKQMRLRWRVNSCGLETCLSVGLLGCWQGWPLLGQRCCWQMWQGWSSA